MAGMGIFGKSFNMGMNISPFLCQSVTDAIRYIYQRMVFDLVNYLDDLATAERWDKADEANKQMGQVLGSSGLKEKETKHWPPNTQMIFLGVHFDTSELILSVTEDRLLEIRDLLGWWLNQESASKKQYQVLLDKLNFISACVKQGRIFVSRIISFMKTLPKFGSYKVPYQVKKDLIWWYKFLPGYNGVSMTAIEEWSQPDEIFAMDACLQGCSGWNSYRQFFRTSFPVDILQKGLYINTLKLLTIIVACKILGDQSTGKRLLVKCDNEASVTVMNSGKSKDYFMQACLPELAFCLCYT